MSAEELTELLDLTGWRRTHLADQLKVTEDAVRKWLKRGVPEGPASVLMRQMLDAARKKGKPKVEATT